MFFCETCVYSVRCARLVQRVSQRRGLPPRRRASAAGPRRFARSPAPGRRCGVRCRHGVCVRRIAAFRPCTFGNFGLLFSGAWVPRGRLECELSPSHTWVVWLVGAEDEPASDRRRDGDGSISTPRSALRMQLPTLRFTLERAVPASRTPAAPRCSLIERSVTFFHYRVLQFLYGFAAFIGGSGKRAKLLHLPIERVCCRFLIAT